MPAWRFSMMAPGARKRSHHHPRGTVNQPLTGESKYISNFRQQFPYLRVYHPSCDSITHQFALFAAGDQRLPKQRRNRQLWV